MRVEWIVEWDSTRIESNRIASYRWSSNLTLNWNEITDSKMIYLYQYGIKRLGVQLNLVLAIFIS